MKKQNSRGKNATRRKPTNLAEEREARLELALRPPQLMDQLASGLTLRFVSNVRFGGAVSISYTNLLDAWLIAGTATNGYQLFDFVKVRRVTLRAIATGAQTSNEGGAITLTVDYPGLNNGQLGSGRQRTQTFLGTAEPAMVSLRPDPKTQASQWQPSSGSTAFIIRATDQTGSRVIGMIVDVELSWKNSGEVNPATVAQAIAGATPGNIYFGGLDGNRAAVTGLQTAFVPPI